MYKIYVYSICVWTIDVFFFQKYGILWLLSIKYSIITHGPLHILIKNNKFFNVERYMMTMAL